MNSDLILSLILDLYSQNLSQRAVIESLQQSQTEQQPVPEFEDAQSGEEAARKFVEDLQAKSSLLEKEEIPKNVE